MSKQDKKESTEVVEEPNDLDVALNEEVTGRLNLGRLVTVSAIMGLLVIAGKQTYDIKLLKQSLSPDAFLKQDNLLLEDIAQQQKRITTQIKLLAQQHNTLEQRFNSIQTEVDDMSSNKSAAKSLLSSEAEINFLIDRAHFKLSYENDARGAIAVLKLISEKAKANSALKRETQSIIESLTPYTQIDTPALLQQLEQLESEIIRLPLSIKAEFSQKNKKEGSSAEKTVAKPDNWKAELVKSIKEVVVIQRIDQPVKPLLNQHERALLQYQLKLKLQQAKMAVLSHQYSLLIDLMKALQHDITPYIEGKTETKIVEHINAVMAHPFPTELPDVLRLQKWVRSTNKVSQS